MSDFPNTPDVTMSVSPDHHWCYQFTIPLLFDDCLSLLQKLCTMWAKMNEIITDFNEWNEEFNTWATAVENDITDLKNKYIDLEKRVSTAESNITTIQGQINTIQNDITSIKNQLTQINDKLSSYNTRISNLETWRKNVDEWMADIDNWCSEINTIVDNLRHDLTSLTSRVKALEDLLANLNIKIPIKILDLNGTANDAKWKAIWNNWWAWFGNTVSFPTTLPYANYEYSPNWMWWDTATAPARELTVGSLGQPVILCKLPFIAVAKSVWDHSPTRDEVAAVTPYFAPNSNIMPSTAWFDIPLTTAYPYTADEIKFQTGVIPFLPQYSYLFKHIGNYQSPDMTLSHSVECCCRIQIPANATTAKMAIAPSFLTVAAVPADNSNPEGVHDFYIYCVCENG